MPPRAPNGGPNRRSCNPAGWPATRSSAGRARCCHTGSTAYGPSGSPRDRHPHSSRALVAPQRARPRTASGRRAVENAATWPARRRTAPQAPPPRPRADLFPLAARRSVHARRVRHRRPADHGKRRPSLRSPGCPSTNPIHAGPRGPKSSRGGTKGSRVRALQSLCSGHRTLEAEDASQRKCTGNEWHGDP